MVTIINRRKELTILEPDSDNEIEISIEEQDADEIYFYLTMEQAILMRDTLDEFIK